VTSLRREIVTAENVPIAIFAYLAGDEHQSRSVATITCV
jgi:hypothetical protein